MGKYGVKQHTPRGFRRFIPIYHSIHHENLRYNNHGYLMMICQSYPRLTTFGLGVLIGGIGIFLERRFEILRRTKRHWGPLGFGVLVYGITFLN